MEMVFKVSSFLVLPFWGIMIFLPHWRGTKRLMSSPLIAAAPTVLYAGLVIPRFAEVWPAVASPDLSGIAALLGAPAGATIAWLHFLAFDLLVGRWTYLDSR